MKGVILVGGFGTRLQPLTLTQPKPLVPFANKPIIKHQIEALAKSGVTEIILAVGYMHELLRETLVGYAEEAGVRIVHSVEESPMGTAGALSLLKNILKYEKAPFFVMNSDIICEFPFSEMKRYHKKHGGEGTILVTQVEDPTRYGVVVSDEQKRIVKFVEKPKKFVGNAINAGIYLFSSSIYEYIENRPMSIENDILPQMVADKVVRTFELEGFWMDIGQPKDYLRGHVLYLEHFFRGRAPPHHLIDPTAQISPKAKIEHNVVIGARVVVEEGAEIRDSVLLEGCTIRKNAFVSRSVVGWGSTVERRARVEECSILGAGVVVEEGICVSGGKIHPNTKVALHVLPAPTPMQMEADTTSPA